LGYSGWGPGQLESEIRTNSWLSIPFNDEILFHTPFQNRWEKSISSLGIAAENLSEEIGHA
jgi:putative transcriptional regulator